MFYPTALALAAPQPDPFTYGSANPVTFTATLTRQDDGTPVPGGLVTFGVDGSPVGSLTTSADGTAVLAYNASSLVLGTHVLKASFARQTIGEAAFETSTGTTETLQVEPQHYAAFIQPPIDADGGTVFKAHGVVPVKFSLTYDGEPSCQLPPATISLYRLTPTTTGQVLICL